MNNIIVECCANSVQSAINGAKGGAARIELCSNLSEGGVTPSYKEITEVKLLLNVKLFVLIRPRKGDFIYTESEFNQIILDIKFCKENNCDGVVIGSLNPDGSINQHQTRKMVETAKPMSVTFHRAFDTSKDIDNDLETIIRCGCNRLLSSGKQDNIEDGIENLETILNIANGRIKIIAGGGVNHKNIEKLYNIGIREFHLSGKRKNKKGIIQTDSELIRLTINKTNHFA